MFNTFILFIGFVIALLIGGSILLSAQSAIHEIEAFILFLISAVLLAGACIVDAVNGVKKEIREKLEMEDSEDED